MAARLILTTVGLACGHWTEWVYDRQNPPASPLRTLPCPRCNSDQAIRVMHG